MFKINLALVFILLYHVSLAQQWTQKANYAGAGTYAGISFSIGNYGYIGTGDNSTSGAPASPQNDLWQYTPGPGVMGGVWTQMTSMPTAGRRNAVGFSLGSKGYVGTGYNSSGNLKDFWEYDPAGNTWTQMTDFGGGARAFAVKFTIGNKGYVGTGLGGSHYNDFWEFDPSGGPGGTWTAIASFPGTPRREATGFDLNGKGYVGLGYDGNEHSDFYEYDASTGQWTQKADYAGAPRHDAVGFSICGNGYVGVGVLAGSWQQANDFWEFTPGAGVMGGNWVATASLPAAKRYYSTAFTIGQKGYVGLGSSQYVNFNELWEFVNTYTAGFKASQTIICTGATITFTDTSGFIADSWKWSFQGAAVSSSTSQNPSVTYPASGTFDVTLTAYSACDSATVTTLGYITVANGGKLTATASPPSICNGQNSTLSVLGGSNYQWFPSTGLNSTFGQTVTANVTTSTTYVVTASSSGSCIVVPDTVVVTVSPSVQVTANNDTSVCSGYSVQLMASGSGTFSWSPGVSLNDSTVNNPVASPSITTTYTVSGGLCSTPAQVVINVGNSAIGGIVIAIRDTICQGTPGNLSLSGNSNNTIQWQSSADNATFANAVGDTLIKYKTNPLLQTTWYRALVGSGSCSAVSDTQQLYVPLALTAYFSATQTAGSQLAFNSDSSIGNIRSYHWDFGDGQTSSEKNPSHSYTKDTTYYVCLTLYDGSNCSYTFCRYSDVTDAVPVVSANGSWMICPNPFTDQLMIRAGQTGSHVESIEMYDVLGRMVMDKKSDNVMNTTCQLNVSSLTAGMYYVVIKTADADYIQKVIK